MELNFMQRNSCLYKLGGTKTFRRASNKILDYYGSNMQNWKKHLREIYRPDGFTPALIEKCMEWLRTGETFFFTEQELLLLRVFIQSDQSGAEALVVAYECDNGDYRQLFLNNIRPHVYVALKLFKDIWTKKLKEHGGLTEDFDIEAMCNTVIPRLKENPFWRDIDKLIKSSDNWSARERYYYLAKQTCHCLSEDTEILTKNGWLSVDKYDGVSEIMIYDSGKSWFESPSEWHISYYTGNMLLIAGKETNQLVTPNHKIIYNSNNKERIEEAEFVFNLSNPRIPVSSEFIGGTVTLPDWQIKLLVVIQADGYINSEGKVEFRFVKERKIDRLHRILKEGKIHYTFIPYNGETTSGNVVSRFTVTCPNEVAMFKGEKKWGSWLLDLSLNNLKLLISELKNWDGTYSEFYQHKREEYESSIQTNVEWMKTICQLVGKQGTITVNRSCYTMGINNRKLSRAGIKMRIMYSGLVYCPTVSTGKFLIRRKGVISITHNSSNYGIESHTLRMNILEKSEGQIVLSNNEAAEFLLVYRSLFPEIPERCRRIENMVMKTGVLYNLFGHPYQITDAKPEEKLKEYFAWSAQSTVGEITRIASTQFQQYIEDNKKPFDLLADTHDSYMAQCPLMFVKECRDEMKRFMNFELKAPSDGTVFHMKSEQNIGFNWNSGDVNKDKNPLGLQELSWLN